MAAKHELGYVQVIEAARAQLGCGAERIADVGVPLHWSWWPTQPDFHDQLLSDHAVPTDYSELENEFRAEVAAIREALKSRGHIPQSADWHEGSSPESASLWTDLNRSADALSLWDRFGMPIRRRGDLVFRLWAPRDVLGGAPIIKSLPIDLYIAGVAQKTAVDLAEIACHQAEIRRWRNIAIALGAALLIFTIVVFL